MADIRDIAGLIQSSNKLISVCVRVCSLEQSLLNIVCYIRYLDTSVGVVAIQIRICQLIELIMKRKDYLSSGRDHKAIGRRPFDKMATLLAYLGPPVVRYNKR